MMMTIKHIENNGEENVHAVRSINYVPVGARDDKMQVSTLWWYTEDGTAVPITSGSIFVMNGSGTTVARYHLSPQQFSDPKAA